MDRSDQQSSPTGGDAPSGFDETLRQLQGIVLQLERGELSLEDSLRAFERGIALSRRGQAILDEAEHRVEVLLRDGRTEPMEPNKA